MREPWGAQQEVYTGTELPPTQRVSGILFQGNIGSEDHSLKHRLKDPLGIGADVTKPKTTRADARGSQIQDPGHRGRGRASGRSPAPGRSVSGTCDLPYADRCSSHTENKDKFGPCFGRMMSVKHYPGNSESSELQRAGWGWGLYGEQPEPLEV